MTATTTYRPLEKIALSTLMNVVKRGKYARYGETFEQELQRELAVRRAAERRVN